MNKKGLIRLYFQGHLGFLAHVLESIRNKIFLYRNKDPSFTRFSLDSAASRLFAQSNKHILPKQGTPTKRQVSKPSGFKTSGFKTSGFKTSGLQNVRFTKRQVSKRLVSKRPVFKFDILIKQKVQELPSCTLPRAHSHKAISPQRRSLRQGLRRS